MDNSFIEILLIIGALILTILFFKYFLIVVGIVAVLIIAISIIHRFKNKKRKKEMVLDDVSRGDIEEFIVQCNTKIQNVRKYYYKLKEDEIRDTLDEVTQGLKKIIKILKEDPRDYKAIRRFTNITLDSTDKILSQSAQLYSIKSPNATSKQGIQNAKEGLKLLSDAIHNQINKLYDNNAMDLDIELKVLKRVLGAKGLLSETKKENEDDE